MLSARRSIADGTRERSTDPVRAHVDVAPGHVRLAGIRVDFTAQLEHVLIAIPLSVLDADLRVATARPAAAGRAGPYLVAGEDGTGLERALGLMRGAHEAARPVAPAHVLRTVDSVVDRARRAVRFADVTLTVAAALHLVAADGLAGTAFTEAAAITAQTALAARR